MEESQGAYLPCATLNSWAPYSVSCSTGFLGAQTYFRPVIFKAEKSYAFWRLPWSGIWEAAWFQATVISVMRCPIMMQHSSSSESRSTFWRVQPAKQVTVVSTEILIQRSHFSELQNHVLQLRSHWGKLGWTLNSLSKGLQRWTNCQTWKWMI